MGITDTPPKDLALNLAGIDFIDIPVPSGREEEWRFTPMRRLRGLHELEGAAPTTEFAITAPAGVRVSTRPLVSDDFPSTDRIAAATIRFASHEDLVEIPSDVAIDEPVVISSKSDALSVGHLRIDVGSYSRVTLVLDITGSGTQATTLELNVGDSANVTFVHIADGDRDQVLASQHHLRVGRDANVQHIAVTLGGDVVRLVTSVAYAGPGGRAEALGVFFTDAGQHHEHRLHIDHSVPHCVSNVQYKGALQGENAHAVWVGDVLIRAEAVGTETYEMNRNLLLTKGAHADSVPNLEIETGNVASAGHASATGRFDEEQLFYLLSRGIPPVEAKRLVVRGFINDLVQRIPVASLRDRLLQRVESRLGAHDPLFDFEADGTNA
jgi:Fe-S cluster assembly protein SufD